MRALIALAAPAIAAAVMIAPPGNATPLSLAKPDIAPHALQVQYGGGGYGGGYERREEYRERRDYDRDRWHDDRRQWRDVDRDDWRRREYRRRMFCREHPGACY